MKYIVYLWGEVIIAGGLIIYLGFRPPKPPDCIICTPTLALVAGILTIIVGFVGATTTVNSRKALNIPGSR